MFACCCLWNLEVRLLIRKLLASATLEILDLVNRNVLPAVLPQHDGVTLLEHPPRGLEQRPGSVDLELPWVTECREVGLTPVLPTDLNSG